MLLPGWGSAEEDAHPTRWHFHWSGRRGDGRVPAGLGRAISMEFARQGASLALIARDPHRLDSTASDIRALGGHRDDSPDGRGRWAEVQQARDQVDASWSHRSVGQQRDGFDLRPVQRGVDRRVHPGYGVNYLGFVHGTKAALEVMGPRNNGNIVQVGSALAYRGIPLQSAYCGAKHAIVGFTESLRTELLHQRSNVRVTMVHMPAMNTPSSTGCAPASPSGSAGRTYLPTRSGSPSRGLCGRASGTTVLLRRPVDHSDRARKQGGPSNPRPLSRLAPGSGPSKRKNGKTPNDPTTWSTRSPAISLPTGDSTAAPIIMRPGPG